MLFCTKQEDWYFLERDVDIEKTHYTAKKNNNNSLLFCQRKKSKVKLRYVIIKERSDDVIKSSHIDHKLHVHLSGKIVLIAFWGQVPYGVRDKS